MIGACFLTAAGAAYTAARWDRNENQRERELASRWLKSPPAQNLRDANLTDFYYRTHHRALADKVSLNPASSFLSAQARDFIRTLLSSGTAALSFYNLNLVRSSTTRPLPRHLQWLAYGAILTPVALKLVAIALDAFSNYTRVVSAMERVKGFIEGFNWLGALGLGSFYAYSSRTSPLLMAAGAAMAGGALAHSIQLLRQPSLEDLPEQVETRETEWCHRGCRLLTENIPLSSQEWRVLEREGLELIQGAEAQEEGVNALLDRYLPYLPFLRRITVLANPLSDEGMEQWEGCEAAIQAAVESALPGSREPAIQNEEDLKQFMNRQFRGIRTRIFLESVIQHFKGCFGQRVRQQLNQLPLPEEVGALPTGIQSAREMIRFSKPKFSSADMRRNCRIELIHFINDRLIPYIIGHEGRGADAHAVLDLCADLNKADLKSTSAILAREVIKALPSPLRGGRWSEFIRRVPELFSADSGLTVNFINEERERKLRPHLNELLRLDPKRDLASFVDRLGNLCDEYDDLKLNCPDELTSLEGPFLKFWQGIIKKISKEKVCSTCEDVSVCGGLIALLEKLSQQFPSLDNGVFSDFRLQIQYRLLGKAKTLEEIERLNVKQRRNEVIEIEKAFRVWGAVIDIASRKLDLDLAGPNEAGAQELLKRAELLLTANTNLPLTAENLALLRYSLEHLPIKENVRPLFEQLLIENIQKFLFQSLRGETPNEDEIHAVFQRAKELHSQLTELSFSDKSSTAYFGVPLDSRNTTAANSLYVLVKSFNNFVNECETSPLLQRDPFQELKDQDIGRWGLWPMVHEMRNIKEPIDFYALKATRIDPKECRMKKEEELRQYITSEERRTVIQWLLGLWEEKYGADSREEEKANAVQWEKISDLRKAWWVMDRLAEKEGASIEAFFADVLFCEKIEGFFSEIEEFLKNQPLEKTEINSLGAILGCLRPMLTPELNGRFIKLQELFVDKLYERLPSMEKNSEEIDYRTLVLEDFDYAKLSEEHQRKLRYVVPLSQLLLNDTLLETTLKQDPKWMMLDPAIRGKWLITPYPLSENSVKSLVTLARKQSPTLQRVIPDRLAEEV